MLKGPEIGPGEHYLEVLMLGAFAEVVFSLIVRISPAHLQYTGFDSR